MTILHLKNKIILRFLMCDLVFGVSGKQFLGI